MTMPETLKPDELVLKPCPFCGRSAEIVGHYGIAPYHVRCKTTLPLCIMQGPNASTREEAVAAWNTRPAEAALVKARTALIMIAHTETEDSFGGSKDMPSGWYRKQARLALSAGEEENGR